MEGNAMDRGEPQRVLQSVPYCQLASLSRGAVRCIIDAQLLRRSKNKEGTR